MGYDSPAAAVVGTLNMDLGGLDSVSVSGLGHFGLPGRNDDDERVRRLQTILHLLQVCHTNLGISWQRDY